jgi:hypothetical protein
LKSALLAKTEGQDFTVLAKEYEELKSDFALQQSSVKILVSQYKRVYGHVSLACTRGVVCAEIDALIISHGRETWESLGQVEAKLTELHRCIMEELKPLFPAPQETPKEFFCPILKEIMVDPVIAEDTHTYEREAIVAWIEGGGRGLSPLTRAPLTVAGLVPNTDLKKRIEEYQAKSNVEESE